MARIFRKLAQLLDVDVAGVADGDALVWDDGTQTWVPGAGGGGGGAPTDADYLVGTANGDLSAEIVVGTSPGGELGGTWASPTVDAIHSGSSHASVQAAAEATAAGALSSHASDTTGIHGIADTSGLATSASVSSAISTSESGQVRDGDTAGGVLGGTYPNPSFASDMATQAELDAHLNDTADAHDASAISFSPTGTIAATDVQAAIAEVASEAGGGGTSTKAYPIDLNAARVSSLAGNSAFGVLGLTDWDMGHWAFLKDVDGKVYGVVRVPHGYVSGGVIRLAVAANATSGVTRLQVGTKAVADGESLNPSALTDETAQDITVPGTAYLRKDVTFTLTETLAADDLLIVEVFHAGAHANDTLAVTTLLLGAWLEVTA